MYVLNFVRGFCMALADSVPGVSGGTIAFILGFYDDFIDSLNNMVSGNNIRRIKVFKFLSKIELGWIVGFMLSVIFMTSVFEKNIYEISSLFLGFIIASIPLLIKSQYKTLSENKKNTIFLLIGIIIVFSMTYFNLIPSSRESFFLKLENLNFPFIIYIFISGLIAISVMVLPNILGSTILLIFALYTLILNFIDKVIKFNFEYLPVIIIFGSGFYLVFY